MAEEFKKVTSLEQLHEILKKGTSEFFVQLNFGVLGKQSAMRLKMTAMAILNLKS